MANDAFLHACVKKVYGWLCCRAKHYKMKLEHKSLHILP